MLGMILSFVTGLFPTINGITAAISNEKIAGINAKTDEERIHSQERVSALQARRDVLIVEAGRPWTLNGLIRGLIALGPTVILLKIFIWDKALGWGSTDALDPNLWFVVQTVLGFYFLSEISFNIFRKR